jgi:hypothetical protein
LVILFVYVIFSWIPVGLVFVVGVFYVMVMVMGWHGVKGLELGGLGWRWGWDKIMM